MVTSHADGGEALAHPHGAWARPGDLLPKPEQVNRAFLIPDGATMRSAILFTCILAVPVMVSSAVTCARKQAAPPAVAAIQAGAGEFESRAGHFALRYPADWSSKPTREYTLLLEQRFTAEAAQVTVDVPYIPPHLPGMMTMKLVANGYVSDLKKRLSGFSVVQEHDDTLAG